MNKKDKNINIDLDVKLIIDEFEPDDENSLLYMRHSPETETEAGVVIMYRGGQESLFNLLTGLLKGEDEINRLMLGTIISTFAEDSDLYERFKTNVEEVRKEALEMGYI